MAFSYRTPAEEFLASLPSEEQSKISSHAVNSLSIQEKSSSYNYSFHLSDTQRNFASSVGIPLSVHPFKVHPHPFCKTLENFLLFDNLVHYRSIIDIYVSIKIDKVDLLRRDMRQNYCKIINRLIADRDSLRYGATISDSAFFEKDFLKTECDKSWFFHDELHHWRLSKLCDFLDRAKPKRILATVVIPVESFEMDHSMNPSFYDFRVHARSDSFVDLTFFPDSSRESAYHQRSYKFWFQYKTIKVSGMTYTLSFLRSIKSHHLVLIERGDLATNPFYISDFAECIPAHMFGFSRASRSVLPLRFSVFKSEMIYLLSLKKADFHSAAAKLRQLSNEGYTPSELSFFCTLATELEKLGGVFRSVSFSKAVFESLMLCFPDRLSHAICPSMYERDLHNLLMTSEPYSFTSQRFDYPACVVNHNFICGSNDPNLVLNRMDKLMYGNDLTLGAYSFIGSNLIDFKDQTLWEIKKMREKKMRRDQNEARLNEALEVNGFTHIAPYECSFEEARLLYGKGMLHLGPGAALQYSRGKRTFKKKDSLLLLCDKSFDELTFLERERRECGEIREVEMEDCFEEVDADCDIEMDIDEPKAVEKEDGIDKGKAVMLDLENLSSGEDGPSGKVSFVNNEFIFDEIFVEGLRSMFRSGFAHMHFSRIAVFTSSVPDLTYGFGNTLYKNYGECLFTDLMTQLGYNSALLQSYHRGGELNLHYDDEEVYDDEDILTWNVVGECDFVMEKNGKMEIRHLNGNEFFVMKAGSQRGPERYRHGVRNCSSGRISITFRNQRRYMNGTPVEGVNARLEHREIPENISELLGKMRNSCFFDALGTFLNLGIDALFALLYPIDNSLLDVVVADSGVSTSMAISLLTSLGIPGVINDNGKHVRYLDSGNYKEIFLNVRKGHISLDSVASCLGSVVNVEESLIAAGACKIFPQISIEDARACCRSMQEGAVGVMLDKFKFSFRKISEQPQVVFFSSAGFAGSGKSRGIQAICAGVLNEKSTLIISPRRNLLDDWKRKIGRLLNGRNERLKMCTFETGLKKISNRSSKISDPMTVIIEEVSLLPGGYIDLVASIVPASSRIVLVFDPLQASFFDRKAVSYKLPDVFKPMYGVEFDYLAFSHRFSKLIDFEGINLLGTSEISENHMRVFAQPEAAKHILKDPVFLCPSEDKKEELKRFGDAYTFGTSQGLTFDFVVISLDMDGPVTSDSSWLVALTRARKGFAFLTCASISFEDFKKRVHAKLIGKILRREKVSKDFVRAIGGRVMDKAKFVDYSGNGRDRSEFEEALEGDPWLKAQLIFLESPELPVVELEEPLRKESPPRTHLEIAAEGLAFIEGPHANRAREFREFRSSNMWSEQFDDCRKRRLYKENRAETFETIYPSHSNSDTLTFWAAVRKRLQFSDQFTQRRKLERLRCTGKQLFNIFAKEFALKPNARVDIEEIDREFIEKRLAKSKQLIAAHSERSDPDWNLNHFFLFMKTQLCTKFEKRHVDAKAGQTLACFSHAILARFGVPIRIAEARMRACLPPSIYIHSGKKLEELNEWCMKYCTGFGTDSDYEAFDRSQDALILAFEVELLAFFGWDNSLITDYVNLKLNLGCRLGYLSIMRFTGEFGTFFLNTCCNMLFTVLRYKITQKTPMAFAGDDMFSPCRLEIRRDREFLLNRFSLKAKVHFSSEPMFCGWRMSKFGIVKEPKLVLERFHIAKEKGCFKECLINYCIEVSFAYRLGERLRDVIRNIEDQQALVRLVVKNKHFLPERVRHEFESYDHEFGGCESVQTEGKCNRLHSFGCGLECNL